MRYGHVHKLKGFTLVEAIVATMVIAVGLMVFFSVFQMSVFQATENRDKMTGEMIADNLIDKILAHNYGDPLPSSWKEKNNGYESSKTIKMIVQGRKNNTTFIQRLTFKNGSFIGKTDGDSDLVTIEIRWVDATGPEGQGVTRKIFEAIPVRRSGQ